ncbi:MAG: metallophosphoesterase [Candidatus Marinimicrobia bacterium]|nr:metallophosphoesterase [Candidatus Neomarinimicrobiota bacterium]
MCKSSGIYIAFLIVTLLSFSQADYDPVRIALIGDPHFNAVSEKESQSDLILDDIQNHLSFPTVDFVLNMGDMTHYGSATCWEKAKKSWNNLLIPWIFVFGNHDTENFLDEPDTPYRAYARGEEESGLINPHFSFLYNDILFLVMGEEGVTHLVPINQKNWLEFITKQYPEYTTVILSHNTLYGSTENSDNIDYRNIGEQDWWEDFFARNPQVKLFLHGHNHLESNIFARAYNIQFINAPVTCTSKTGYFSKYIGDQCVYLEIGADYITARKWHAITNNWDEEELINLPMQTTLAADDPGMQWYSATWRVQDGQEFTKKNRILAESYKLQLSGESDRELVLLNRSFDHVEIDGNYAAHWWGYDNAYPNKNGSQPGQILLQGKDHISASTNCLLYNGEYVYWIEGKLPYSTVPRGIPGKKYRFRMKAKANTFVEDAINVIVDIISPNIQKVVARDTLFTGLSLTTDWQWFEKEFTLPQDTSVWGIKTIWESKQSGITCYLDEWSIERVDTNGLYTKNFNVTFNNRLYQYPDDLDAYDYVQYDVDPLLIKNNLKFSAEIEGNRIGFIRFIYEKPILWSDDVSVGVNSNHENDYNIHVELASKYVVDRATITLFDNTLDIEGTYDESIRGYYLPKQLPVEKIPGDFNVRSGNEPDHLQLFVTPTVILSSRLDSTLLTCIIEDGDDFLCPDADNPVYFSVIGEGEIKHTGAIFPVNGVYQNIFYPGNLAGTVKVIVASPELHSDTVAIEINDKIIIDDFDTYDEQSDLDEIWSSVPGLTATVSLSENHVYSGQYSLQFDYSLGNGSPPYSGIIRDLLGDYRIATAIHFWLVPDSSQRDLVVRLYDQANKTWDYYIPLNDKISNEILIRFQDFIPNTSVLDVDSCKWKQLAFYILTENGGYGTGTLYIDDLEFRFLQTTSVDRKDTHNHPEDFRLYPNYPNPFNSKTVIQYYLQRNTDVTVTIYDIRGRLVRTLVSTRQNIGLHRINFDAGDLATGIYFLHISAEGTLRIRKMLLLK